MIKGIIVDLTIRDNITGAYLRIPVVPPTIPYSDGEAISNTVKILNIGSIDIPDGVELDAMGWESFFPARYDPGYCSHSDLKTPVEYRNQFSTWKDSSTSLQIVCPAAGINKTMKLTNFAWELRGFEGDIYYVVGFKEHKTAIPKQIGVQVDGTTQAITAAGKPTPEGRAPVAATPSPKTYTVKSGDTLTLIAKKLGIASWRTIYDNNKAVIGNNPNVIYPGQVYMI